MSKITLLFLLLVCSLPVFASGDPLSDPAPEEEYYTDQCYIQLRIGETLGTIDNDGKFSQLTNYTALQQLLNAGTISSIETSFKVLAKMDNEISRVYTLKFANPNDLEPTIASLNKLGYINFAEKVPVYKHLLTPNDPLYATASNRWHLDSIQAELGWNISTGCANVVIAIVDDAVLTTHEDLTTQIATNSGEIAGNGIDDDNNGYIDDVNGYDVADNDNNPNPPTSATNSFFTHGTHVAGIAGAASDNGIGIASLGFNASLLPVKVKKNLNTNPGALDNPMDGVEYAIASGANVINMSWGGYGSSNAHQLVFNLAYTNGITCVAAAGNDGLSFIAYPADYNHVISVGATDTDDDFAPFTNFSEASLDVWAPGVNIFSTLAGGNNQYGSFSGTSMAAPLVSALASLMICNDPTMGPADVENCMENSATLLPTVNNPVYQIRLINPAQSLQCSPPIALGCQPSGCEMVANGDFETPSNSNLTSYPGWSGLHDGYACSWLPFGYGGTSDVFPTKVDSVNNYANFLFDGVNNNYYEGVVSNVLGLIPGREYIVEFDYAVAGPAGSNASVPLDSLVIGLVSNGYVHDPWNLVQPFDHLESILNVPVDYSYSSVFDLFDSSAYYAQNYYNHYSFTFVAGPNVTNTGRLMVTGMNFNVPVRRDMQLDNVSVRPIIEVQAMATDLTIGVGDCTDLSATGTWDEYVWEPAFALTNPVGNNQNVCPDSTVTYIVSAYDSLTGCSGSDTITIVVDKSNSINDQSIDGIEIKVYPNPVVNLLSIEIDGVLEDNVVTILDQNGRVTYTGTLNQSGLTEINTEFLSQGVYHCQIGTKAIIQFIK